MALLTIKVKRFCSIAFLYNIKNIITVKYWPLQTADSYVNSIILTSTSCRMAEDFEQLLVLLFAGIVNGCLGETTDVLLTRVVLCCGVKRARGGLQSSQSPHFCWWGHCWVACNVARGWRQNNSFLKAFWGCVVRVFHQASQSRRPMYSK